MSNNTDFPAFPDSTMDDEIKAEMLELIKKKDLFGAIRLHRQTYNSSLLEAQSAIEQMTHLSMDELKRKKW